MSVLVVVNHPRDWPFEIAGTRIVTARDYLTDPAYSENQSARVLNLCRAERYQGRGYYVSLLAEARGHRPLPDVKTVEDLKSDTFVQAIAGKIDELANETLRHGTSDRFELDAYFGRDPAQAHQPLAEQLFANVRAPLLRSRFLRS